MSDSRLLVHSQSEAALGPLRQVLAEARMDAQWRVAPTRAEVLAALSPLAPDLILCDAHGPELSAAEILVLVRRLAPDAQVVLLSRGSPADAAAERAKLAVDEVIALGPGAEPVRTFLEILERQRERHDRRRTDRLRDLLFARTTDLACIARRDGTLEEANPAWTLAVGGPEESWRGRPLLAFIEPADRVVFSRWWHAIADDAPPPSSGPCEVRIDCGALGRRHVLWSAPSPSGDGRLYLIGRDTTERHRAAQALREREERLLRRAALQSALAAFNRDASTEHPLVDLLHDGTRLICSTLQVEGSEVFLPSEGSTDFHRRAATGIPLDAPGAAEPTLADGIHDGVLLLAQDGERFPGRAAHADAGIHAGFAVALGPAQRPTGVITVLARRPRDFSRECIEFVAGIATTLAAAVQRERAHAALAASEQKLLQSQKMEAVGMLAGGIAHDFNNLLTAIRCYGDILHDDLAEAAPQLQARAAEILRAASRASSLTRQLLAFSRKQVVQPEVLDLNTAVSDLRELLRSLLSENIALRFEPSEEPQCFEADRNQIEQVIINLCINARDAMPSGGTIHLHVASRFITDDNPHSLAAGEYVTLSIADTGIGMTPEVQARLFQPFFTTKPKGRGTGLGLATCAVIVKNSQGAIEFASEPGAGTTFTLLFPRIATPGVPSLEDEESHLIEGREHILLVEDDEAIRTVTEAILQSLGYRVTTVSGGAEAIASCQRPEPARFDLLLTDVVMPDMDGRDLADRVAALSPGIRVLFMSGYVGDPGILQAVQAAGGRFLEKPFTRTSLGRRVRETLDAPRP